MRKSKGFVCICLVCILMLSCCVTTFAATTRNATTGGNGTTATVLTIKTDKTATVSLTQTKGRISYQNMAMGHSTLDTYGDFFIYVVDKSGKDSPIKYEFSFKKSTSFKLKAGKTYEITVCPNAKFVTYNKLKDSKKLWYQAPWENDFKWEKNPTWSLTAKKVISLNVKKVSKAPQQ